jgi:hypothetical protein
MFSDSSIGLFLVILPKTPDEKSMSLVVFQLFTNGARRAYPKWQERGFSNPATDDELSKRSYS